MHKFRKGGFVALALLLASATATVASAAGTTGGPRVTTVLTGLNNPRGLAFGRDGALYLAEAGRGGPFAAGVGGDGTPQVLGFTSSVDRITGATGDHARLERQVTGLVSVAQPDGTGATGADGVAVGEGGVYTVMTASAPALAGSLAALPRWVQARAAAQLGRELQIRGDDARTVADVGAFDYRWTGRHAGAPWAPNNGPPDFTPQFPDANPYGILTGDDRQFVVDAASNTVDVVRRDGTISILAYIPNPTGIVPGGPPVPVPISDAVPTCVARGPDGALYVGTLAFAPFFLLGPGHSNIYRIDPHTSAGFLHAAKLWATGFSTVTGCGFDRHGNFYATQFIPGTVVRLPFHHALTDAPSTYASGLIAPNGLAIGPDGAIYVSNASTFPGRSSTGGLTGSLVRIS